MWAIIKIDKKKFFTLKNEIFSKLGNDVKFYMPKIKLKKYLKSKIYITENHLLGDYLLCFHKDFRKSSITTSLKYCKGLKYFLSNFRFSQNEIEKFINTCKKNEDQDGYVKQTFFNFEKKDKYEFISGPFTNFIFSVLKENQIFIEAFVGKYKIKVSKEDNLFRPI